MMTNRNKTITAPAYTQHLDGREEKSMKQDKQTGSDAMERTRNMALLTGFRLRMIIAPQTNVSVAKI